ncbi:MAG TPA: hypothetical protein VGO96_11380 [Pyrinomonadaceae bacterium]|nr:hypothetical protein [Pyrinomonadaceae bacterium]
MLYVAASRAEARETGEPEVEPKALPAKNRPPSHLCGGRFFVSKLPSAFA